MSVEAVTRPTILGDWGTSRLRLFRFSDGKENGRADGPGIGALEAPATKVLTQALEPWRNDGPIGSVTLCGMAGARGGLVEAGYLACPVSLAQWQQHSTSLMLDGLAVRVLPGLRCRNGEGVPDVMRGEETQIFGAIALDETLAEGAWTFVLPGTHCKWVLVVDGVVLGFRTYPTGELYTLLTAHSTLVAAGKSCEGDDAQGFARGLARVGERTLAALFEARAAQLVDGRSPDWAKGFLSGLLIGGEVEAEATKDARIVLIGDPTLCERYVTALINAGCSARQVDGDAAVLAGLELAKGEAA
ncbi:2-dehydro-3-deoxygalactonokinase [Sphingobium sp. BS19]|uniref:2-dehydro-3-deoxygalactonokinase n=1 Tax=Sphingobium sp. BS19 TaxID=3018973 RepID=UPI0022EE7235|nr:2-dehydro-3-deoxygalactonokinase [Sphingobium sp. BS19]GLI96834.1 2-dehydro-3-deoxygalactonokinase [Sphingobium sp. BS19]